MSGLGQDNTKCSHCGSSNRVLGVRVGLSAEAGSVGLDYKAFIVTGTEPFFADLCKDCGTVTRFYVKTTEREWRTG